MPEVYALHEGAFGRAVVLEPRDDLAAQAHAETQLALWLGRTRVEARLGSHNAWLLDRSGPAVFRVLYISKPWLDERRAASGRPFFFATPGNFSRFFREHMGVTRSRFRRAASRAAPHSLTGTT